MSIKKVDETLYLRAMAAAAKATKGERLNVPETLDLRDYKATQGQWLPASGGTEQPFWTRNRRRLQYVYQPSTGRHAYLDLQTDIILDDEEARLALGN
jgi:hypothetical protein